MEMKKKIFVRIGAMMALTESEFALLQEVEKNQWIEGTVSGQAYDRAAAMVREKLDRGEYEICGETYFPERPYEIDGEWWHNYDIDFLF